MSKHIEENLKLTRGKGSTHDPYVTTNKEMLGIPVWSMFRADHTKNSVVIQLKKNLKTYDPSDVNEFVTDCAAYITSKIILPNRVNTILVPTSSSPLVSYVADAIKAKEHTIKIIQDSFKKAPVDQIKIDDTIAGFTPAIGEMLEEALEYGRKTGHFELKRIGKPHFRKYIKGFMQLQSNVQSRDIAGKHVMILDDILTKGTTIVQCAKDIAGMAPESVSAATIFKFS